MGFSISSPDLDALLAAMTAADPIAAYHRAAEDVGIELEGDIGAAFRDAGAPEELIDAIGTYVHTDGTTYVGVPADSHYGPQAREIEYGSPTVPPAAPVRNAVMSQGDDLKQKMTVALDQEMGKELRGGR